MGRGGVTGVRRPRPGRRHARRIARNAAHGRLRGTSSTRTGRATGGRSSTRSDSALRLVPRGGGPSRLVVRLSSIWGAVLVAGREADRLHRQPARRVAGASLRRTAGRQRAPPSHRRGHPRPTHLGAERQDDRLRHVQDEHRRRRAGRQRASHGRRDRRHRFRAPGLVAGRRRRSRSTPAGSRRRASLLPPMMNGRDVVIVEAVRTPIGRGSREKGYYRDVHPNELLGAASPRDRARRDRPGARRRRDHGLRAADTASSRWNIGRNAWLQAGLPVETPATTSTASAARGSRPSTSRAALVAIGRPRRRHRLRRRAHGADPDVRRAQVRRRARDPVDARADASATRSSTRGSSAELIADSGTSPARSWTRSRCARTRTRRGRPTRGASSARSCRSRSTGTPTPRTRASAATRRLEVLAALQPAFKADGKVTAGNSSQISDGAAAVLLMAREKAAELGAAPAGEDRRPHDRRRRPRADADRPDPGDAADPRAQRHGHRGHRPDRDQRGLRIGRRRLARASSSRTWTG